MLLPHFAFPAQAPSVTSIAAVFDARSIALSVGNKEKLVNLTAGPTGLGVAGQGRGRRVASAEDRIGQTRNGARWWPWTGSDRTGTAHGGGPGQDRTGQGR